MIYELLYIVPSRYSDTEIEGVVKTVQEGLQKNEATIEKTEILGKVKFAYSIKKERYGTYVLVYMTVEGEKLAKIDADLKLTDEILRHVIVKRENGIPKESFKLETYEAPITAEGKRVHQTPKVEAPKRVPAPTGEKMSMKELDKKLDSILDSDIGKL